jgi:ATP-binding cassette subfamily B protein
VSSIQHDQKQADKAVNTLLRIARMALVYRWRMLLALLSAIAAACFQLMIPQILGRAVDNAYGLVAGALVPPDEVRQALWAAAGLLLVVGTLRGLFTMLHNYQGEAIGQSIGYELRLAYYEKLQRLSFSYHDRVHTGDLMTRGMLDVEGVRTFVDQAMIRLTLLAILIVVGSFLMLRTDPVLAFLSLSFVPFVAWRAVSARLRLRVIWRRLQEHLGVLTRIIDENLAGIRVVRAFGAQDYEMAKFDRASADALALAERRVSVRFANTSLMTFTYFLSMTLVLWAGSLKVLEGAITVGTLAEFLAFMTILQMPVRQVGMVVNAIARASISGQRLFEVLDLESTIGDRPGARPLEPDQGVLRFEDVHFAYRAEAEDLPVLHGISFEVGPGRTVGIVGPPGSGKTTIAHLIPRFYDVTGGRITIDGLDIRDVTLESLRAAVGVIQQDSFMFTASIENNVAYGDPWADRERVTAATESAQLHRYIDQLPLGYRSLVGERGVSLSGGQRQRLSIARSTLLLPSIIVFDDATAAIDAATEQRIRAGLGELTSDRATIIISHRLNSLMHADEILFLEAGRVVERGTHEQLIAGTGPYRAMYDLQARQGPVDADGR